MQGRGQVIMGRVVGEQGEVDEVEEVDQVTRFRTAGRSYFVLVGECGRMR